MIATRCILLVSAVLAACAPTARPAQTSGPEAGTAPTGAPSTGTAGTAGTAPTGTAPAGTAPASPSSNIVPSGPPGQIQIVAGSYGPNCGAPHGNVTAHIASACNGRASCDYKVDYTVIGDPAVGCHKHYIAEWHCGTGSTVQSRTAGGEAGYGSVLSLSCAKP